MEKKPDPIVAVHLTSSDEETLPVPGLSTEERENTPPRQSFTDSSDSSDSANGSDSTETEDDPLEKFVQEWNRLFKHHIPQTAWGLNISQIKASSYLEEPYKLFHGGISQYFSSKYEKIFFFNLKIKF